MDKRIRVEVDQASWPEHPPPEFPETFTAGSSVVEINIPAMLLLIGFLTTPVRATGVSLGEHWSNKE